jgi:hypothetical protein
MSTVWTHLFACGHAILADCVQWAAHSGLLCPACAENVVESALVAVRNRRRGYKVEVLTADRPLVWNGPQFVGYWPENRDA